MYNFFFKRDYDTVDLFGAATIASYLNSTTGWEPYLYVFVGWVAFRTVINMLRDQLAD